MGLTLGSLFDGIGGWLASAIDYGIKPLWSSEVERFPLTVTKRHYPDVQQVGDIRNLDGGVLPSVDIICMGSPCQDLSLAGKREGLDGKQSGLFREATRIIHEMRRATNGKYPRFVVWENVPGAFSSNKGADFQAVLQEIGQTEIPMPTNGKWANAGMAELPQCEIAWRVLDAQYWGVPQRRRRIFLVADFAADGRCAKEILFECEGVSGHLEESERTREGTARGAKRSSGTTECGGVKPMMACYDMTHADEVMRPVKDGIIPTLAARMGTGGNQVPVVHTVAIQGSMIGRNDKNGPQGSGLSDVCFTLNTVDRHAVYAGNVQKVGASNCMHDQQCVMFSKTSFAKYEEVDNTTSLRASGGNIGGGSENLSCQSFVRRLTPTECERLQGLPDGYTLIEDKSCSDSARYKALGNGMAKPCSDYVLRRLAEVVKS